MEIGKLKEGMAVKNYKEMCKVLKEQEKGAGNSRNGQIKEWERYFKWHKEGHRFVIDEIYESPKEKVDGRGKTKGKYSTIYGKYIEKLILDLLAQNLENGITTVNFSKSAILEALVMVNKNYVKGLQNKQRVSKTLDIDVEYIKHFYNNSYSNLQGTLESALKRLSNKSLITWKEAITLVYVNNKIEYTIANDDLEKLITKIEVEVMEELECHDRREVVLRDKWNIFMDEVCNKLLEYNININYYFRSYKINFNEYVTRELKRINEYLLENEDRINTQVELNGLIVTRFKEYNKKRYEKYLEEFALAFGERHLKPYNEIKISKDYVPYNNILVDELIKVNI